MNKKIVYLFLALLLPGLVFLFLKFFGQNKFDIPVYFQNGVDSVNSCAAQKKGQYFVNDSLLNIAFKSKQALLVVESDQEKKAVVELIEGDNLPVALYSLDALPKENKSKLKDCVLFLKSPWNAVLIDNQKRIRGYYDLGHRDDFDRFEVELKILLQKY